MMEKLLGIVDEIIEIIRGDDPVIDQIILDDFEYHYHCNVRCEDVLEKFREQEAQKQMKE